MSGLKLPSINTKTLQASSFSRGVYDPQTFVTPAGFVPLDMKDFTATSPDFAAAAYVNPKTGELVVAYRGSDSKTDLLIAQQAASGGKWNAQFTDAASFAKQAGVLAADEVKTYGTSNDIPTAALPPVTPLYTGHSLGGLLATVTSAMFGNEAVVFDAPGGAKLLGTADFVTVAKANGQSETVHNVTGKIQNFAVTSVITGLGDPIVEPTWLPVLGQPSFTDGLITIGSIAVNPALGLVVGGATKVVEAHSSVTIEEAMYTLAGLQPHLPNAGPLTVQNMYIGADGKPTANSYRTGEEPGGTTRVQALVDDKGNAVGLL